MPVKLEIKRDRMSIVIKANGVLVEVVMEDEMWIVKLTKNIKTTRSLQTWIQQNNPRLLSNLRLAWRVIKFSTEHPQDAARSG
jgi:hypothetical protein